MSNFRDFRKGADTLLSSIKMGFEKSLIPFSSNVGYAVLISLVVAGVVYYTFIKSQVSRSSLSAKGQRGQATKQIFNANEKQDGTVDRLSNEQVNESSSPKPKANTNHSTAPPDSAQMSISQVSSLPIPTAPTLILPTSSTFTPSNPSAAS